MHLHYIHGHACQHNLMSIGADYNSDPYKQLLNSKKSYSSNSFVWADTPFNSCNNHNYKLVCEDFGYTLNRVEHSWNKLSGVQLWNLCTSFNWSDHVADVGVDDILDLNLPYIRWYNNLFKTSYTWEDYLNLMRVEC